MNFIIKILFYCLIISPVMSYYFYNPKTKQVISTFTLNVPKGFRIMQPPKTQKLNRETFTRGLYCQDIGFSCTQQFNYSSTYQFECENDSNCPKSFICCPQNCFTHRVCTKAALKLISRNSNKNGLTLSVTPPSTTLFKPNNNRCENWPYDCYQPYPAYLTYRFKCDYDQQCPNGFKCCQQSCFTHKICSKSYEKLEDLRKVNNRSTKLNNINYQKAATQMQLYGIGINDNRETNKYLQSNYPVENKTDLVRTTKEEEENGTEEETITEDENITEEENSTEKQNFTEEENSTEEGETVTEQEVNRSQTPDPNSIDPDYRHYYEYENEDEDEDEGK